MAVRARTGRPLLLAALLGCGARTGLETLSGPVDPCAGAPVAPLRVTATVSLGSAHAGTALAVARDAVYFSTGALDASGHGIDVARAPIRDGAPDPSAVSLVPTDRRYASGALEADGTNLYFPLGVQDSPELIGVPVDGGALVVLHPLDPSPVFFVNDLATNDRPGVFFEWNGAPSQSGPYVGELDHWDGARTSLVATFPEGIGTIAVDARQAFVETSAALYSVALPQGVPVKLRSVAETGQLFGLTAGAVVFAPDQRSIVRLDRASGAEEVVVRGVPLEPVVGEGHTGWVDSTGVYYVTGPEGQPATLWRVPLGGGSPEVVWDDPNRPPTGAVATDACNLYWLTGSHPWSDPFEVGPSILMVQKKK